MIRTPDELMEERGDRRPIVAEVRKARSEIFEEPGRDLKELARAGGRKVVNRARERGRPDPRGRRAS